MATEAYAFLNGYLGTPNELLLAKQAEEDVVTESDAYLDGYFAKTAGVSQRAIHAIDDMSIMHLLNTRASDLVHNNGVHKAWKTLTDVGTDGTVSRVTTQGAKAADPFTANGAESLYQFLNNKSHMYDYHGARLRYGSDFDRYKWLQGLQKNNPELRGLDTHTADSVLDALDDAYNNHTFVINGQKVNTMDSGIKPIEEGVDKTLWQRHGGKMMVGAGGIGLGAGGAYAMSD